MPTRRHALRLAATVPWATVVACATPAGRSDSTAAPVAVTPSADAVLNPPQAAPQLPGVTPTARPPMPAAQPAARALPGRLLFVSDANVWLLERGQPRRLTGDRISRQPAWSRDGQQIALVKIYTSGSDLWVMDFDGSNSVELTDFSYRQESQQSYALRPAWLPDGSGLLYISEQGSQDTQLWQLSLANRRRQRYLGPVGDGAGGVDTPVFSPDGTSLALTGFQAGRGPAGRPQIWTWTPPSGPWRQVTSTPEGAYDPAWSPDGQRLAYTVRSAFRHDIWIAGADGSGARQVTTGGFCRAPTWSPDGAWIAYLSAQSGTFDVWAVPLTPGAAPGGELGAGGAARQITKGGVVDAGSGLAWGQ